MASGNLSLNASKENRCGADTPTGIIGDGKTSSGYLGGEKSLKTFSVSSWS